MPGLAVLQRIGDPTELARQTGLSSDATTAMLDRLERSGLIERRPKPDDLRGTLILIVKERAEKVAPLFESARKAQEKIVSGYSEKELKTILVFFRRSVEMWKEERDKLVQRLTRMTRD